MLTIQVISISIGKIEDILLPKNDSSKPVKSGINKSSISHLNNRAVVNIKLNGINGDQQADLTVHGGVRKAVYVYPHEHYSFWNQLLRREIKKSEPLNFGALGENLTVQGVTEEDVFVGDRWEVGSAVFEVTELREPCFKFNIKMEYKGAAKAMVQSKFSGWYLSVVKEGAIRAGDHILVIAGKRETSIADQNANLLQIKNQKNLDF
ncbi:MAG: MOSC domain-containing protein [Betaproteobacteria bacterium]